MCLTLDRLEGELEGRLRADMVAAVEDLLEVNAVDRERRQWVERAREDLHRSSEWQWLGRIATHVPDR